jgi:hypothetical protein
MTGLCLVIAFVAIIVAVVAGGNAFLVTALALVLVALASKIP